MVIPHAMLVLQKPRRSLMSKSSLLKSKTLVRTSKVNDQDVEFEFDTGSTLTETTSKILDWLLQKVDHQLSSADGLQFNVISLCDVRIDSTYVQLYEF